MLLHWTCAGSVANTYLTILSAIALIWLEKQYS